MHRQDEKICTSIIRNGHSSIRNREENIENSVNLGPSKKRAESYQLSVEAGHEASISFIQPNVRMWQMAKFPHFYYLHNRNTKAFAGIKRTIRRYAFYLDERSRGPNGKGRGAAVFSVDLTYKLAMEKNTGFTKRDIMQSDFVIDHVTDSL
ncbi:hypothetical protein ACJX0J_010151, partial [Zea mays]